MPTPRLFAAHITLNLPALSLSRTSGIDGSLVLGGVSWFVMFAPLHCRRLASLVSSYCCMVLMRRQGVVQRLSVQSSVAISTWSLAVWRLGVLYFVLSARLRCYEVLGKLFLDGSLSLRVDSSEKPKLPDFGSRLNLTHLFARIS
ncbi:hypothetical protein F2Q68_00020459 [Brassica cretica]|uniref:Uncharacterized protein n=1 Tax=Brassica cretica TaxID=69181 RepID=A0A8S9G9L4_BRACR|nr:hypothetical protein F2Q68_00020459 [Brassica cretica]